MQKVVFVVLLLGVLNPIRVDAQFLTVRAQPAVVFIGPVVTSIDPQLITSEPTRSFYKQVFLYGKELNTLKADEIVFTDTGTTNPNLSHLNFRIHDTKPGLLTLVIEVAANENRVYKLFVRNVDTKFTIAVKNPVTLAREEVLRQVAEEKASLISETETRIKAALNNERKLQKDLIADLQGRIEELEKRPMITENQIDARVTQQTEPIRQQINALTESQQKLLRAADDLTGITGELSRTTEQHSRDIGVIAANETKRSWKTLWLKKEPEYPQIKARYARAIAAANAEALKTSPTKTERGNKHR